MHTLSAVVVVILVLADDFFYPDQKKFPPLWLVRVPQTAVVSGFTYT
jgi:hypothetical protein